MIALYPFLSILMTFFLIFLLIMNVQVQTISIMIRFWKKQSIITKRERFYNHQSICLNYQLFIASYLTHAHITILYSKTKFPFPLLPLYNYQDPLHNCSLLLFILFPFLLLISHNFIESCHALLRSYVPIYFFLIDRMPLDQTGYVLLLLEVVSILLHNFILIVLTLLPFA